MGKKRYEILMVIITILIVCFGMSGLFSIKEGEISVKGLKLLLENTTKTSCVQDDKLFKIYFVDKKITYNEKDEMDKVIFYCNLVKRANEIIHKNSCDGAIPLAKKVIYNSKKYPTYVGLYDFSKYMEIKKEQEKCEEKSIKSNIYKIIGLGK